MSKLKNLSVTVTYRVGLGDIDLPKSIKDQLIKASERGQKVIPSDNDSFFRAGEWLSNNIRERDCFEWEVEIDEIE